MAREGWTGLNISSWWFCRSHGANEQDKVRTAAEASVGVKSELPKSGCPYATQQIQDHRGLLLSQPGQKWEQELTSKHSHAHSYQGVLEEAVLALAELLECRSVTGQLCNAGLPWSVTGHQSLKGLRLCLKFSWLSCSFISNSHGSNFCH